jgi:hypothetical protein
MFALNPPALSPTSLTLPPFQCMAHRLWDCSSSISPNKKIFLRWMSHVYFLRMWPVRSVHWLGLLKRLPAVCHPDGGMTTMKRENSTQPSSTCLEGTRGKKINIPRAMGNQCNLRMSLLYKIRKELMIRHAKQTWRGFKDPQPWLPGPPSLDKGAIIICDPMSLSEFEHSWNHVFPLSYGTM